MFLLAAIITSPLLALVALQSVVTIALRSLVHIEWNAIPERILRAPARRRALRRLEYSYEARQASRKQLIALLGEMASVSPGHPSWGAMEKAALNLVEGADLYWLRPAVEASRSQALWEAVAAGCRTLEYKDIEDIEAMNFDFNTHIDDIMRLATLRDDVDHIATSLATTRIFFCTTIFFTRRYEYFRTARPDLLATIFSTYYQDRGITFLKEFVNNHEALYPECVTYARLTCGPGPILGAWTPSSFPLRERIAERVALNPTAHQFIEMKRHMGSLEAIIRDPSLHEAWAESLQ